MKFDEPKVITGTDAEFDNEVLKSTIPVLVFFCAEWAGPCRAMKPLITELARNYHGRLKVVQMDVDNNTRIPSFYNITAIPTVLIIKDGQVIETIVGAPSKSKLVEKLDRYL